MEQWTAQKKIVTHPHIFSTVMFNTDERAELTAMHPLYPLALRNDVKLHWCTLRAFLKNYSQHSQLFIICGGSFLRHSNCEFEFRRIQIIAFCFSSCWEYLIRSTSKYCRVCEVKYIRISWLLLLDWWIDKVECDSSRGSLLIEWYMLSS